MRPSLVLPALLVPLLSPAPAARAPRDVEDDVAKLLELRDAAPPELLRSIADSGSAAGLEGLLAAYERMGSAGMRMRVLEATTSFCAGWPDRVVPWLVEAAKEAELGFVSGAALDALDECGERGRAALWAIAEGRLPDTLREDALERHAYPLDALDADEVLAYLRLWKPGVPERSSRGRDEEPAGEPPTARMRRIAFEVALPRLGEADLAAAVRTERDREIRQVALLELHRRGTESCVPLAMEVFSSATEQSENRAAAAGVLWERLGSEIADELVDVGTDNVAPLLLRYVIADLLEGQLEPKLERKLVKTLRSGHEYEQLFALRALRSSSNPKVVREMTKLLDGERPNVALFVIDVLRGRGEREAAEPLAELVEECDDPALSAAALAAWSELERGEDDWWKTLEAWTRHEDYRVRAAAYREAAEAGDTSALEVLERGLAEDRWPCQYAALRGVEALRSVAGVGLLVDRLQTAEGRLRHELSEALWRLTGQAFGEHPRTWQKWFAAEAEALKIVDEAELERLRAERLQRLLDEQTVASVGSRAGRHDRPSEFFGVRVRSNRIVFVIDVSGSMQRTLKDVYDGSRGLERFEVAKIELRRCLDILDPSTDFTIVAFSAHLKVFEPELVRATAEEVESAHRFIDDLDLAGGTDVWAALARALEVEDVDTIYLLSDGEPEGGAVTDPVHIRMAFRRRNIDRAAVVHAIALGGELPLLRWLSEDTGGSYTRFR